MNVFGHTSYKQVLHKAIEENKDSYGYKSHLAKAAGCQRSFLSQVLNGTTDLMLEHAAGIASFLNFSENETEYFISLLSYERAGTTTLQKIVRDRLTRLRSDNLNLSKRFKEAELQPEASNTYYSVWYYSAVHMFLTVPEYQSIDAISDRLAISRTLTARIVRELETLGLAKQSGGKWKAILKTMHIGRNSKMNAINHRNWREKAIQNSLENNDEDTHYTSVCSIGRTDAEALRAMLLEFIDKSRKLVAQSGEEEVYCMTCDFFRV